MKRTYIYCIASLVLLAINVSSVYGQEWKLLKVSPELLLGKWTSNYENKAYEFEFRKDTIHLPELNRYSEVILGRIIIWENNVKTKETRFDEGRSILYGSMTTIYLGKFSYTDYEEEVESRAEFEIDPNNHAQAVFRLTRSSGKAQTYGWHYNVITDIPRELEFHKIE